MMQPGAGLLLVLMQPPAALEEEFTAWYDTEHVPERAAVPGFRTALRYVCLTGYPRFAAVYDLDAVGVLDSPEYQAVSGPNFSPWTKRVTSRVQVYRIAATQIFPGDAATRRSSRLTLLRFRDVAGEEEEALVDAVRTVFDAHGETAGVRVFKDVEAAATYFALLEASPEPHGKVDLGRLGPFARRVDITNVYTPYTLAIGG